MLFFIQNNKNKKQLELNTERNIEKQLTLEEVLKVDKRLSVMRVVSDNLYFVSWSKGNEGKLFDYSLSPLSYIREIDLNIDNDPSMIIGIYNIDGDTLYFHDKMKNSIVKALYNKEVKIEEVYKYPKQFQRMSDNSNNSFIVSGWNKDYEVYFDRFDYKTKKITNIDVKDQYIDVYDNSGITLDGVYYSNEKYSVLLPYGVNRVYLFDRNFSYKGKMNLIYGKLDFEYRDSNNEEIYVDPNNLYPNLSAFVDKENKLYILTDHSTQWDSSNKCFIDVYNLDNRKYIESYKIDDYEGSKPRHIVKYKDYIIVLFENTINKYLVK